MKQHISRMTALLLFLLLITSGVFGCASPESKLPEGAAPNDIITFQNNAQNKPVIRILMQYYTPDDNFITTLEQEFPDYVFVQDYTGAAGTTAEVRVRHLLERQEPFDMIVSSRFYFLHSDLAYFCDLSAERFLNNYLLSSLNNISEDGRVFFLPGVTAIAGIAYNKQMFEEHGWQVPRTTDAFFELCKEIRAAGIIPFSNCCKYANQVHSLFGTMCYDKLYMADEDILWMQNIQQNKATYKGHMEPMYELAKRFADEGVITLEDFSASLTKQRQAFWKGEYAMMYADTVIYSYAKSEGAAFDIGFMPFPAEEAESSGYCVTPSYYIAIPKTVEQDPERLALMKEILAFLSTPRGQQAMLAGSYNISNVKGVNISDNPAFPYIREAYENGNLYPQVEYYATDVGILGLQQDSIKTLFEGASAEEAIAMMDDSLARAFTEGTKQESYDVIAAAEADFTMLETSYYMADKLREAAGADIGLMINNSYFRANLATIDAGDITADMRNFIMKGVGGEDWLTKYRMTGAQIRDMMEHPIVNGTHIDALIAASGLAVEYAPWNERGSRVQSLTMEDGTALLDDKHYTVAAWAGVIDERYITDTVQTYDALGGITDILENALRQDGVIKPDIAGRVTLVWPEIKG